MTRPDDRGALPPPPPPVPHVPANRHLRVMADYGCSPVWYRDDVFYEQPLALLPISAALTDALLAWANDFDDLIDWGDPAASGFRDDAHEAEFDQRSIELAAAVRAELGPGWRVDRFSYRLHRHVDDPRIDGAGTDGPRADGPGAEPPVGTGD